MPPRGSAFELTQLREALSKKKRVGAKIRTPNANPRKFDHRFPAISQIVGSVARHFGVTGEGHNSHATPQMSTMRSLEEDPALPRLHGLNRPYPTAEVKARLRLLGPVKP